MNRYKLIIFDLDGTLLNTKEGVIAAVEYTIKQIGYKQLCPERMDGFIGPPIQESFIREYGIEGDEVQKVATIFRNRYKDYDLLKAELYDGILETLKELKGAGVTLAVATYKREDYALKILDYFGLSDYFNVIHGADHENKLKKSDIIRMCMDEVGIKERQKILLIGDTENDETGAKKVGIDFLGVSYGFGYKVNEEIMGSYAIGYANNPIEILNYVFENEKD